MIKIKNNIDSELTIAHRDNEGAISIDSKQLGYSHYPVADVDAMRLLTNSPDTIVTTDGRYGSHYFKKVASGADNGGTIIVLDNLDKYELQYDGAVNVKWFGAKGDGVTNDFALMQKAFDSDNKDFYIPKSSGDYIITPDSGTNLQLPNGKSLEFGGTYLKYVGVVTTGGLLTIGDKCILKNPLIDLGGTVIGGSSGNNGVGIRTNSHSVMIIGGTIKNCPRGNSGIMDGGKGVQMEGANSSLTIDGTYFYGCHMAISSRRDPLTDPTEGGVLMMVTNVFISKCNIALFTNIANATYVDGREYSVSMSNFIIRDAGELGDGLPNDKEGIIQFGRASNVVITNGTISGVNKIDAIFRGRGRNLSISNIQINTPCEAIVNIDPSFYAVDTSLMYGNRYEFNINGDYDYLFLSDLTDITYTNRFLNNSYFLANVSSDALIMLATPATRNGSTMITISYNGSVQTFKASDAQSKKLADIIMNMRIYNGSTSLGAIKAMPTLEVSSANGVQLSGNAGVNIDSVFETLNSSQTGSPAVIPTVTDSRVLGTAANRWLEIRGNRLYGEFLSISGPSVLMSNLPTADPHVKGQLWNNAGAVTVSAG